MLQTIPSELKCVICKQQGPVFSVELRPNNWITGQAFMCWECFKKNSSRKSLAKLDQG